MLFPRRGLHGNILSIKVEILFGLLTHNLLKVRAES